MLAKREAGKREAGKREAGKHEAGKHAPSRSASFAPIACGYTLGEPIRGWCAPDRCAHNTPNVIVNR